VLQINRHFDPLIRVCRAGILPSRNGCPRTPSQLNPILPPSHVPFVQSIFRIHPARQPDLPAVRSAQGWLD
jgi:hypothetical protein